MNELFNGLEYVGAYIDDFLTISNGNFEDHLNKVKTVLDKKQLRSFIQVINYYSDMWKHRSDILNPLARITFKQAT